jgi:thioredoxin-related protein
VPTLDLPTRRAVLAALPALLACTKARAATLPASRSLRDELGAALAGRRPLLVMASLHGCPFCRTVRDSHLAPLAREGQPVVQLDMGSQEPVAGFAGEARTHQDLLAEWGVKVAPTVLFFGRRGAESAPRLEGASIPDYYGAYLQQRIDSAVRALQRQPT